MVVNGKGKALETRLVQMAFARRMVVGMVTLGVRGRDPAQHPSHQPILGGPQNRVPVVGHQGKGEQRDGIAFQAFAQHTEKGRVVLILVKSQKRPPSPFPFTSPFPFMARARIGSP